MENKRDIIEAKLEKIDKFVFNIKNINRIIAVMLSLFMILLFVTVYKRHQELDKTEKTYQQMLDDIKANQLNFVYSNVTPNKGEIDASKIELEPPMFKKAKQAVVYAFDKFYSYNTFELVGYGSTEAVAVGQHVEIEMNLHSYRFETGTEYDRLVRKETKTNFGQSDATEIVYKNNQRYNRKGSNIRKQNGEWVADFYGSYQITNFSVKHRVNYLVTDDTVIYNKNFSFVRDKQNNILYYQASVLLHPVNSVRDYSQNIMEEGGTSYPEFSEIELSCIIDRDGNLMSYSIVENMTITKKIVVDITTTTTNRFNYVILSHDTDLDFAEPAV